MTPTRTILLGAALLAAPAALAQQHGGHDHSQMDHGQMQGMEHSQTAAMGHDALMALHMRMMADPEVHAAMQADSEMQALMAEAMPAMDHSAMSGMDHSQMQGMDHSGMDHAMPQDADAQAAMMAQMGERMRAMSPADHAAFMARFEAAHRRLLATPAVHMRMMADPEARRLMEALPGGMPGMGGMDHGQMDHGQMQGMDHSQMSGTTTAASGSMPETDHSQMAGMSPGAMAGAAHAGMSPAEHAAGVAMQRRNAGASNGDEREQAVRVGPAAFDASDAADRFHAALAAGDRAAMEAILAPDAVVLEGGAHESRAEYLSHHFARDAASLAGTAPEPLYRRTGVAGDGAWVASTQRVGGAERAELLVMTRTPDGWRVAAVHWSSTRR